MKVNNIFSEPPYSLSEEFFEILIQNNWLRLERIVSTGQATPSGEWYDQDTHEWVLLLSGSAGLIFKGEEKQYLLRPGDFIHIPAHTLHRVEWTERENKTVWLALHYT